MLQQSLSNKLWDILEHWAYKTNSHTYTFSRDEQGTIRIDTFSIWRITKNKRREKKRDYSRFVRSETGSVLYDQLDMVSQSYADDMQESNILPPDIPLSPERANKLLSAALKEQEEVDKLIVASGRQIT